MYKGGLTVKFVENFGDITFDMPMISALVPRGGGLGRPQTFNIHRSFSRAFQICMFHRQLCTCNLNRLPRSRYSSLKKSLCISPSSLTLKQFPLELFGDIPSLPQIPDLLNDRNVWVRDADLPVDLMVRQQIPEDTDLSVPTGWISAFTDGSTTEADSDSPRSGLGVWFGEDDPRNVSCRLWGRQSNAAAEITAITAALYRADPLANLVIFSDSTVAIATFEKAKDSTFSSLQRILALPNRSAFLELRQAILSRHGLTEVRKVPAHAGIQGNVKADALAKLGALHDSPSSSTTSSRAAISASDLPAALIRPDGLPLEFSPITLLRRSHLQSSLSSWKGQPTQGLWVRHLYASGNLELAWKFIRADYIPWKIQRALFNLRLSLPAFPQSPSQCPLCHSALIHPGRPYLINHIFLHCPQLSPARQQALRSIESIVQPNVWDPAALTAIVPSHPDASRLLDWVDEHGWMMWTGLFPKGLVSSLVDQLSPAQLKLLFTILSQNAFKFYKSIVSSPYLSATNIRSLSSASSSQIIPSQSQSTISSSSCSRRSLSSLSSI